MDAHHAPLGTGRGRMLPVTPAQIVAIGLVAASVGWAAWLLRELPAADRVDLLEDTVLTAPQLAAVEAALDRAQLTDYRAEAGRVWVPRGRQSAYKRAVVDADALPKPWGTRFRDAVGGGSVWASPAARAESLKVALQDELALVLGSMPGIERAAVMVDQEAQSGFRQEPLKTASVGIRTVADAPLDSQRARAIRVLVAAAIAGLEPEHVAVTDLSSGQVFSGPLPPDPEGIDPRMARRMQEETALAGRVKRALEFVPGVAVDVAIGDATAPRPSTVAATVPPVAADAPTSPDERAAAANAPADLLPAAPPADPRPVAPGRPAAPAGATSQPDVHVTIAVPDSYLAAAIGAARGRLLRRDPGAASTAESEIEEAETERLREIVRRVLGGVVPADRLGVLVTAYPTETAALAGGTEVPAAEGPAEADAVDAPRLVAEFPDLHREGWLALSSIAVGLLAGFLWWAGSRERAVVGDEEWSHGDEDDPAAPASQERSGESPSQRRPGESPSRRRIAA